MSRSLRRGTFAASALVLSLASLTACGAGNNAQTLGVKPDSAATSIGDITIQAATLVTQPELDAKGPAVVTGTVFNNGRTAQTLDSITLPGTGATVKLSPAKGKGPVTVPPNGGSVRLGGEGNASAVIEDGREAAQDGNAQPVVFSFSDTGDVGLRALVVPATSFFEGVGPSTQPSPTASPSASESPAADASESPSGTESGSASESGQPESGQPSDSASASSTAG
ncbi:DUF461 domain-containing protein [Streptomyces sp. NPDC087420]|uniref:DUF461 domain-containing protein n=1 Tax=Streptomyces sp. NPDC087420 TaxID=3365785 RepID=UPI003838C8DA